MASCACAIMRAESALRVSGMRSAVGSCCTRPRTLSRSLRNTPADCWKSRAIVLSSSSTICFCAAAICDISAPTLNRTEARSKELSLTAKSWTFVDAYKISVEGPRRSVARSLGLSRMTCGFPSTARGSSAYAFPNRITSALAGLSGADLSMFQGSGAGNVCDRVPIA